MKRARGWSLGLALCLGSGVAWSMGERMAVEPSPSTIVIASSEDFSERVERAPGVVLVDFWATWCGPCRYMNPIVAEVAKAYGSRLTVAKVDVDKNPNLAQRFKIQSIPTFMIFKDGKMVDMILGARPKDQFAEWVARHAGERPAPPPSS